MNQRGVTVPHLIGCAVPLDMGERVNDIAGTLGATSVSSYYPSGNGETHFSYSNPQTNSLAGFNVSYTHFQFLIIQRFL